MNTDVSGQFPAAPGCEEIGCCTKYGAVSWVFFDGFLGLRASSVEAGLDGVVEAIIEAVWLDGL